MFSWLAAVKSEIHTNAGSHPATLAAIDRARATVDRPGLVVNLPWFDYYGTTRLPGLTGYTTLQADRQDDAGTTPC